MNTLNDILSGINQDYRLNSNSEADVYATLVQTALEPSEARLCVPTSKSMLAPTDGSLEKLAKVVQKLAERLTQIARNVEAPTRSFSVTANVPPSVQVGFRGTGALGES
jgi:hypothetical protein